MLNGISLNMVVAAAEIKVFELKLEFELPQKRSKIHFHSICHFVFFWSITLKLSIKLVLCCSFLHLCNKFKVSNFDWHDWRTVAWVLTDLNSFKAAFLTWLQITPIFAHWLKCAIGCLYAVIDYRKDQISFPNSYPTFCWVNLKDFPTLGTCYCLISATRGNIVSTNTGTYNTICISLTLMIRYINV